MALSSYLAQQLAEWFDGTTMPAAPSTVYVGLFTAGGAELSGNGYARIPINAWGSVTAGSGEYTVSNAEDEVTPTATGSNWATATQFRLYDSLSGGNALTSLTALDEPRTVTVGGFATFLAGTFTFHMPTTTASAYLAQQICEWIAGITFPAAPSTVYLGLLTSAPAEISGNGYTRAPIPAATWATPSDTGSAWATSNSSAVVTGTATVNWSATPNYALFDALSGGNQLTTTEAMGVSLSITAGGYAYFPANDIDVSFPYAA
jgi:hypothetical protein